MFVCANNAMTSSIMTDAYIHFSFRLFENTYTKCQQKCARQTHHHLSINYSLCSIVVRSPHPTATSTRGDGGTEKNDLMISMWLFVAFAFYFIFGVCLCVFFFVSHFSFHGLRRVKPFFEVNHKKKCVLEPHMRKNMLAFTRNVNMNYLY